MLNPIKTRLEGSPEAQIKRRKIIGGEDTMMQECGFKGNRHAFLQVSVIYGAADHPGR